MGPEIGLAASARDWSDRFHRFLLDHGGGTVRSRVMSPAQAVSALYDVLFVDDVCSFLNQRLVIDVRASGKSIVGVFDPSDGTDAKRRLLEAGIGDVIESDARPEEFLEMAVMTISHSVPPRQVTFEPGGGGFRIGLTGPPGGVGVTEVSCALALDLSRRHKAVLVDANPDWPSIGQRLGLPVHPNLRTGIDFVLHEPERVEEAVHSVGDLAVLPGPANPGGCDGLVRRPRSSDLRSRANPLPCRCRPRLRISPLRRSAPLLGRDPRRWNWRSGWCHPTGPDCGANRCCIDTRL